MTFSEYGGLEPPIEIGRDYSMDQLLIVTESDQWRALTPNALTATDLSPRDLYGEEIDKIVGELLEDEAIAAGMTNLVARIDKIGAHAFEERAIPGVGTLVRVGFGESKICYQLRTDEGKMMAVQFRTYDPSLGIQIPPDPKLTLTWAADFAPSWEYSDARTYLFLPLKGYYGVAFQEWAGTEAAVSGWQLPFIKRRVLRYLERAEPAFDLNRTQTDGELDQSRHYFRKPGHKGFAVIDIPLVERRW